MPFTPFHMGPALALGLPFRRYLHVPTFIVGNVVLDVEGLLVIVFGLNYPLHGYLHTLLLAVAVGLLLGFVMFKLEPPMQPFYRKIQLETNRPLKLKSFIAAGILGAILHVGLDAFLYSEMMPLFPLTINPLLNFISSSDMYLLCFWMGIFGIAYYLALLAYTMYKKKKQKLTFRPSSL
jgi:membrane-bound metal-dependent hydrolase YbcI (DUF457 family)